MYQVDQTRLSLAVGDTALLGIFHDPEIASGTLNLIRHDDVVAIAQSQKFAAADSLPVDQI